MLQSLRRSNLARAVVWPVVVAVAFVWVLPSFASYTDVWRSVQNLDERLLIPLLVASVINVLAPAGLQRAALPGLGFRHAVLVDWMTSAVTNTVPGGSAIAVGMTWSMYRRLRLGAAAIARSLVVTGVWDQIFKLSAPLLAVAWLSTERPVGPGMVQAAVAGGVLFAAVLVLCTVLVAGPRAAAGLGALLERVTPGTSDWSERIQRLRVDTLTLVQDRWQGLTGWTVVGHLNLFVLLLLCLRALEVPAAELSAAAIFAALAFGRLVTALPLTPGGLGVMEVGLTGALAAVGTAPEADIVAAVLIFRFITFAATIPLGALAWLVWTAEERAVSPTPEPSPVRSGRR